MTVTDPTAVLSLDRGFVVGQLKKIQLVKVQYCCTPPRLQRENHWEEKNNEDEDEDDWGPGKHSGLGRCKKCPRALPAAKLYSNHLLDGRCLIFRCAGDEVELLWTRNGWRIIALRNVNLTGGGKKFNEGLNCRLDKLEQLWSDKVDHLIKQQEGLTARIAHLEKFKN